MPDDRRRYRKIYIRLWKNPAFRRFGADDKLVTLYLLSGPQTNRIGLYHLSLALATEDLGYKAAAIRQRIDRVCQTFAWQMDWISNVVWIPSWWDFNAPSENPKNMTGALSDIHEVPASPLIEAFARHLVYVPASLHAQFGPILARYNRSPSEHRSITDRTQEQEKEQEQEQEQDSALTRVEFGPDDLLALWNATAQAAGLRPCLSLAGDRLTHARNRLREQPERAYWDAVIARISASPGCRGHNDRQWVADMDFLLRKATHVKVLEGKYDAWGTDHSQPVSASGQSTQAAADRVKALLRKQA